MLDVTSITSGLRIFWEQLVVVTVVTSFFVGNVIMGWESTVLGLGPEIKFNFVNDRENLIEYFSFNM